MSSLWHSSVDLGLTVCRLFGPLEQAVTAVVILSLGTYGQNEAASKLTCAAMQGRSTQPAPSHIPPRAGMHTNSTTGQPPAASVSAEVASTLIGLVSDMASNIDTATLALLALVANLLLMTMSEDLKCRLKESWNLFWPPWQDRTHTSSHRPATATSVVPEGSTENVQVERGRSRAVDAEPVPRSSRDGTGSRGHRSTGDTNIPVEGEKQRAGKESKPDTDIAKAAPRQALEVGEEKASQVKSSRNAREAVEPSKSKSVSSGELAGPSDQGADPSERERAKMEGYEKAKREAHERAEAKDPEKSKAQGSDARSADELNNSQGKDGDGEGTPRMMKEGAQTDKEKAKRETYEKAKREAYERSRAERTAKASTGDQIATKAISKDLVDDTEKGGAKPGIGIEVGKEEKERGKAKRAEVQAKERGRDVPPHIERSGHGGPDESAEQQAKREAYEKAKKMARMARATTEGDAAVQSSEDASKEISVANEADRSPKKRTPESEEDRLKRKALEKARLEAYEKAKREKGAGDGGILAVKGGSTKEGEPTESDKAQKARKTSASADKPRTDAAAASKGERIQEDKP